MKEELERFRTWAHEKTQSGEEPPWAWYQYMKLIETCDAILVGMAATVTKANSPQSEPHSGAHLRLVDSICQPDNAQPRHVGLPVQLPM